MVNGKVIKWNVAKGFGFVEAEDGTKAFVHTTSLNGGSLVEGEAVTFDTAESDRKDKKLVATNVKGNGVAAKPTTTGKLTGTVKKWSVGNSLGFIQPDGDEKAKDVYVHSSAFGGGNLEIGKKVTFDVEDVEHKSGRKVAINVAGEAVRGVGKHTGTVKTWIHHKGYGFVEDAENEADEVYVHCTSLGGGYLLPGKKVFFDIGEKKDEKETRRVGVNVSGPAVRPPDVASIPVGRGSVGRGSVSRGGFGRGGRGHH